MPCKKKLMLKGSGEGQIYVCPGANCNFREKASVFKKRFEKGGKVDKRDVQKYIKQQAKEAEKQAAEDNPFAALGDLFK